MAWSKGNILEMALSELKEILPRVRSARVVRSFVLKEPAATFSPTAESERLRPGVETNVPELFIAGDWVRTGWPGTMESAVRGGYLAAEAVLRTDRRPAQLVAPELPPSGLMKLIQSWICSAR
jgi:zeta-carotene desaturase